MIAGDDVDSAPHLSPFVWGAPTACSRQARVKFVVRSLRAGRRRTRMKASYVPGQTIRRYMARWRSVTPNTVNFPDGRDRLAFPNAVGDEVRSEPRLRSGR
jgi:hypothetical protein